MKKYFSIFLSIFVLVSAIFIQKVENASSSTIINEVPVIIVDAGHGDFDGGAVATDGTNEKDINLEIAFKLNEILTGLGYKTRMVRTDDTATHNKELSTIREKKISDTRNRTNLMTEYESCIYISIHQNKYDDSSVWGTQTFYSPNDAKSQRIAEFIQAIIVSELQPTNHRQVKKSGSNIYILYNATKPCVMVECGFISNPKEFSQLKDGEYQSKIAFLIAIGIINYNISEVKNGTEV